MRTIAAIAILASVLAAGLPAAADEDNNPAGNYGRGFAPPPFEPHSVTLRPMPRMAFTLPSRFDWREQGMVTPVKHQKHCGACYAFAGLGDIESKMLIAGEGTFDFSENNVKECEWFGRTGHYPAKCDGGTYWRIVNHLVEYGTVMETCDRYLPYNATCKTTCPYIKTVLDWRVFSLGEVPPPETIKSYLMQYGPIFVAIDGGLSAAWQNELNAYDGSYTLYYPNSASVSHAVLIVGWDDELTHEGGTGGWIAKNSWGTSWGGTCGYGTERGYFYIAYGSANIGWYSSFLKEWKDFDPCDKLLFYDEAGYYSAAGYNTRTAWGMCKFIAGENIILERVEFWTTDATQDIDIFVYDSFSGSAPSGELAHVLDTPFTEMGYHSVLLPTPLEFTTGEEFYIAVKFTNEGYKYPLTYDPSSLGPRAPGMCFWGPTDQAFTEFASGDLGIRARVRLNRDCEPPDGVSSFDATADDNLADLAWTNPTDSDFDHVMIRYSNSDFPVSAYDGEPVENGMDGMFFGDPGATDGFVHTGLEGGKTYYYSSFAGDTIPNYSVAVTAAVTPGDSVPPDSVEDFEATPNDRRITLTWMNPGDVDLDGVLITYSTEGSPTLLAGGIPVENGRNGIFDAFPAMPGSFTHMGLNNDTTYYYCIWAFDTNDNYSSPVCIEAVPEDLMPPELSISVLQNPLITNHLDIYVIPSEPVVDTSIVVTVGGTEVDVEDVPGDEGILRHNYEVYASGELEIGACARDLRLNRGCASRTFGVTHLLAGSGGLAPSPDGRLHLTAPAGALDQDTYVIVSESAAGSGGIGHAYSVSPRSLRLHHPVRISFAYDGAASPENLAIARVDGGEVHPLESYVMRDEGRIVAFVDRLGTFGLLEQPGMDTPDFIGDGLRLMQNVPNPFSGSTRISFSVSQSERVRVVVVSVRGRTVKTLIDEHVGPGIHNVDWDGTNDQGARVAGGVYFYRVTTRDASATRKMVILQ